MRWVWVRGFPVRDAEGKIRRLVGTALEITAQKEAEEQVGANLALAKSAWAEAEALRNATLSLTQDLRMDCVMDALLRSLEELVPYTCARVLVPEGGPHVLALGERLCPEPEKSPPRPPLTLIADESSFLHRVLAEQKSVLIEDTKTEEQWQTFKGHKQLRSWLSVPLLASGQYLGCLSVGHVQPSLYSQEHLRRAELLAIGESSTTCAIRWPTGCRWLASRLSLSKCSPWRDSAFIEAAMSSDNPETCVKAAQASLEASIQAGELLTEAYLSQILQNRLAATGKLSTNLGCMLTTEPDKVPFASQWLSVQRGPGGRLVASGRPFRGAVPGTCSTPRSPGAAATGWRSRPDR